MTAWLLLSMACAPVPTPADVAEDCFDGVDNDGNGRVDCEDWVCQFACLPDTEQDCFDGQDADRDGLTDCEDPDCHTACLPDREQDCFDGQDEDEDGLTDCADPDCVVDCAPGSEQDCFDGQDEDLDGLTDCADPDCAVDCAPTTEGACADGIDNDLDGLTDCLDPDCASVCVEECGNGVDDDQDGRVDCEDVDCEAACSEDCENRADDDGDGFVDCEDDECWGLDICISRSIQVTEADYQFTFRRNLLVYTSSSHYLRDVVDQRTTTAQLSAVRGQLRASSPGGSTTCSWTASQVLLTRSFDYRTTSFPAMDVSRTGLVIDSGCPLTESELGSNFQFFYGQISASFAGRVARPYGTAFSRTSTIDWTSGTLGAQRFYSYNTYSFGGGSALVGPVIGLE